MGLTRAGLAARIDHTILTPEATRADVVAVAEVASAEGCAAACVQPSWVPLVADVLRGSDVATCSVVGFPSGASPTAIKAAEAALVVDQGAGEVDVVVHLGHLVGGDHAAVVADLVEVRAAAAGAVLKVIVESALLTGAQLDAAVDAALEAGADFVKTSTGFHPSGGASIEAVSRMAARADGRAAVKASGGIRTLPDVEAMLAAGADRLGMSATVAVLDQLKPPN